MPRTRPRRLRPGAPDLGGVPPRALVLGCRIDRLNMAQTLTRCEDLIARHEFAQHVAINADKLVAMHRNP